MTKLWTVASFFFVSNSVTAKQFHAASVEILWFGYFGTETQEQNLIFSQILGVPCENLIWLCYCTTLMLDKAQTVDLDFFLEQMLKYTRDYQLTIFKGTSLLEKEVHLDHSGQFWEIYWVQQLAFWVSHVTSHDGYMDVWRVTFIWKHEYAMHGAFIRWWMDEALHLYTERSFGQEWTFIVVR